MKWRIGHTLWPEGVLIINTCLEFTLCRYTLLCLPLCRLMWMTFQSTGDLYVLDILLNCVRKVLPVPVFSFPLLPALCDWVNRHTHTLTHTHTRISSQTACTSREFTSYVCRFSIKPFVFYCLQHTVMALNCFDFLMFPLNTPIKEKES